MRRKKKIRRMKKFRIKMRERRRQRRKRSTAITKPTKSKIIHTK